MSRLEFDPTLPESTPRDAATVILIRGGEAGLEAFLLRRHRKASFVARSFVFPGGLVEEGEDARLGAARELFEEAGVLLARGAVPQDQLDELRRRQAAGEDLGDLLREAGLELDLEQLVPWSHWITPSSEKRRYSARFFVAELPAGQTPRFDDVETVDERWVTPSEGLERADELALPPPQLRTLWELAQAPQDPAGLLAAARERAAALEPIVPRYAEVEQAPEGFALLLPWDAEYASRGQGASHDWPAGHPLGVGPSRFFREGEAWRQTVAP